MRSFLAAACAASLLTLAACGAEATDARTDGDATPPAQTAPADDAELETVRIAVSGMG
jgi:hypothetical protein